MPLDARRAERRLVLLTTTRWLPVGLTFGLTVLLPLERGVSLGEVGGLLAIAGFVSLALELPTGGLADTIGRRPLLLVSGALALASATVFVLADSLPMFAVALVLQGVFRALDSGPLESWYVDTAHADDPAAPVDRALSRASAALGSGIAIGALVSGGLVAWHPLAGQSALVLPYLAALAVQLLHLVLVAALVREPRAGRMLRDGGEHPVAALLGGFRLLRTSPVLRALVGVELFWAVAMIAFETLTPVGLADLLGGEDAAATVFGPASAAAWALFAVGSWLAGVASRRIGVVATAILARLLNAAFVVVMGLAAGVVGLVVGYWLAYLTHGSAGPMHNTLLHRQSGPRTRTMVLSINSMVASGAAALALLALPALAEHTTPGVGMIAAGAFSAAGALLYLPALRQERASGREV